MGATGPKAAKQRELDQRAAAVAELLDEGMQGHEIAKRLGLPIHAVQHAKARLGRGGEA